MAKGIFLSKVRLTFLKGMEAVGTTASNMASNAKLKAAEINLENRRREILTNFSLRAFEMWQKGVKLPDSLSEMLEELSEIEDRLSVLRAQKYAKVVTPEGAAGPAQAAETQPEEEPESADTPVSCAVGDEEGENAEPVPCTLGDVEPDETQPEPDDDAEKPDTEDEESSAPDEEPETAADDAQADPEPGETAADAPQAEPETDTPQAEPDGGDDAKPE